MNDHNVPLNKQMRAPGAGSPAMDTSFRATTTSSSHRRAFNSAMSATIYGRMPSSVSGTVATQRAISKVSCKDLSSIEDTLCDNPACNSIKKRLSVTSFNTSQQIRQLRDDVAKAKTECKRKDEILAEVTSERDGLLDREKKMQANKDQHTGPWHDKSEALLEQNFLLSSENETLKQEIANAKAALDCLRKKVNILESKNNQWEEDADADSVATVALSNKTSRYSSQALEASLNTKTEMGQLERKNDDLQRRVAKLEKELEEERESFVQRTEGMATMVDSMRHDMERSAKENDRLMELVHVLYMNQDMNQDMAAMTVACSEEEQDAKGCDEEEKSHCSNITQSGDNNGFYPPMVGELGLASIECLEDASHAGSEHESAQAADQVFARGQQSEQQLSMSMPAISSAQDDDVEKTNIIASKHNSMSLLEDFGMRESAISNDSNKRSSLKNLFALGGRLKPNQPNGTSARGA